MTNLSYDTFEMATADGPLRVGRWGQGEAVVLAAHGVTANHRSFLGVAEELGDAFTVLAPDLRGRGGSNGIAGPFGMAAHAADVAAVLENEGARPATLIGHSMGGFVAVVTASMYPHLVRNVVLIDGGFPLDLGPLGDMPTEELVRAVIGPSLERLRMTFESVDAYLDFWRPHPALQDDWSDLVEKYLRYDLVGEAPALRSGVNENAVIADSESDLKDDIVERSLAGVTQPVLFLRAPRGVFNQEPPLYAPGAVDRWRSVVPQMRAATVPEVNHFTITLARRGARAVADAVKDELERGGP